VERQVKKVYQTIDIEIFTFPTQDIIACSVLSESGAEDDMTHKDVYDSSNKWWKDLAI
jgi:hypothetical protein